MTVLENGAEKPEPEKARDELPEGITYDKDDSDDIYCGIGSCRPSFLQPCANMQCFVAAISITGFLTACNSSYISSQITTLERTFGFSSRTSGFIMSCNDIGYLVSILFAAYFARRTHIPRVLYIVITLYGMSSLVCAIPYFLTSHKFRLSGFGPSSTSSNTSSQTTSRFSSKVCSQNSTAFEEFTFNTCAKKEEETDSASLFGLTGYESMMAVVFIAIGMVIQGFAKAPRSPFITTFVDDNSSKTKSPLYIGIIFCITIFGPACAFALGGLFSRIYVTLEESKMNYRDPKWIGAWWLGFLIFGSGAVLAAMPIFLFPRHLVPKSQRLDVNKASKKQTVNLKDIKGLLQTLRRLVSNPVYCSLLLGTVAHALFVSGRVAFFAKYVETLFHVPVWKANIIVGGCSILIASLGTFVSGLIISRLKLSSKACVKFVVVIQAFSFLANIPFFFLGCPPQDIRANWNVLEARIGSPIKNVSCLKDCYCDTSSFRPACDVENGVTYYSPCHAGCSSRNGTMYTGCSCVPSGQVVSGYCPSTCSLLTPFMIFLAAVSFIGTMDNMAFVVTLMRSVSEEDKPLALGLQAFLSNLLGWLPGPILFGRVIDSTCLIWNTKCSRVGSCALYDVVDFKLKLNGLFMGGSGLNLVFFCLALYHVITKNFFDKDKSKDTKTVGGQTNLPKENGESIKEANEIEMKLLQEAEHSEK